MTGADLHESKGTAAAGANTAFIADGAGSGAYAKVPAAALSASANPFGAQLLHVREQQASLVNSATSLANGVPAVRQLNTVVTNEIAGASLASSQITLPAGIYFCDGVASVRAQGVSNTWVTRLYLYDFTTATVLIPGLVGGGGNSGAASGATNTYSNPRVSGRFTLAGTNVLQLLHYINGGAAITPGEVAGIGPEIYADLQIWKVG